MQTDTWVTTDFPKKDGIKMNVLKLESVTYKGKLHNSSCRYYGRNSRRYVTNSSYYTNCKIYGGAL